MSGFAEAVSALLPASFVEGRATNRSLRFIAEFVHQFAGRAIVVALAKKRAELLTLMRDPKSTAENPTDCFRASRFLGMDFTDATAVDSGEVRP
ncbi:MAG: hypothetical protein ACP5DC_09485 [Halothiobacillaceae bacterium]